MGGGWNLKMLAWAGASLRWKSVSRVFLGTFVWGGGVGEGQGVGRLGAIFLKVPHAEWALPFKHTYRTGISYHLRAS